MPRPQTTDEYLGRLTPDKRAALQRLRKMIRTIVPRAEECISYGIPAFRLDGKVLVWCGASTSHCSFYLGGVIDEFAKDLKNYRTRKGTIQFSPDETLPASLVRKLIKARVVRMRARAPAARTRQS